MNRIITSKTTIARTAIAMGALGAVLLTGACAREEAPEEGPVTDAAAPASAAAVSPVTVQLSPTAGNQVTGTLTLAEATTGEGVRITGTVSGLTPDTEHGFHIHEYGDCSAADASSAGGHFSPSDHPHGAPGPSSHAGDLGNIVADAAGVASIDKIAGQTDLADGSAASIVGKTIIVHAAPDDLTSQPSGESGARLACGVIPG